MRILIVKTSSLGDIIHCFPAVEFIRKKYPDAQIDWVVERPFAGLVRSCPYVSRAIEVDTKLWRRNLFSKETRSAIKAFAQTLQETEYDVVFDLQGNFKSALITWKAYAKDKVGFGKKTVAEWPNLFVTQFQFDPPPGRNIREDYLYLMQSYFLDFAYQNLTANHQPKEITGKPQIMVCPGSAWPNKQMTPGVLSDFLSLINKSRNSSFIFVWGNDKEKEIAMSLQKQHPDSKVLDKVNLQELYHLMCKMDLIIAVDSLPLHLAGTTNTPTFSVFGPSLASKYRPIGSQHHSMQGSCPYKRTFEKRCPILRTCATGACIRSLTGQEIFNQFQKTGLLLSATSRSKSM